MCCHVKINNKIEVQNPKYIKKNCIRKFRNIMGFICHTLSFRQDVV